MIKTEFNPNTGEIGQQWASSDLGFFALNTSGEREFLDGEYKRETHYVDISLDPVEVKARPSFTATADKTTIVANGSDVLTVSGLPEGSTRVAISGPITTAWIEDRNQITLTANIPGSYQIRFTQFPYLPSSVDFDAA